MYLYLCAYFFEALCVYFLLLLCFIMFYFMCFHLWRECSMCHFPYVYFSLLPLGSGYLYVCRRIILQGFLTAMRQEITRAHKGWALDSVVLMNDVTKMMKEDITTAPGEGKAASTRPAAPFLLLSPLPFSPSPTHPFFLHLCV